MTKNINHSADSQASQLRRIAASLPQSFGDLSPELVAEEQFVWGVRRLSFHDGVPTAALRSLIDSVRYGMATLDDVDKALDALEDVLAIAHTGAVPALADGAQETKGEEMSGTD